MSMADGIWQERRKLGENNNDIFLADVYAYQGKFEDAAKLYEKAGHSEKVCVSSYVCMCTCVSMCEWERKNTYMY